MGADVVAAVASVYPNLRDVEWLKRHSQCGYCFNCELDVKPIRLRTHIGGPWNGGRTSAGVNCRRYLRGHFKYV